MLSEAQYLKILGVPEGTSLSEIKRAYRAKAKLLHPDVSKEENAQEQFVLLTEAYEFFTTPRPVRQKQRRETEEEMRKEARIRAAAYARMRYAEFINSDYYKSTSAFSALLDAFIFIFLSALLACFNWIIYKEYGKPGFSIALLFDILIICLIVIIAKKSNGFNLRKYDEAIRYLITWPPFNAALMTIVNIYIFLRIGLQTLISFNLLVTTFVICSTVSFILLRMIKDKRPVFVSACLVPLALNILLTVNYTFVSKPSVEQYTFQKGIQESGSVNQETTMIHLENGVYENYPGVRIFLDYHPMQFSDQITYSMAEGCLGFRVMKDYRFD